jgi:8-oxo-dGTP diphosphatase
MTDSFSPLTADSTQIGFVWLPIVKLTDYNFFPRELIPLIQQKNEGKEPDQVYIGDKN